MKWYHRAVSGLLAASVGVSLLGSVPHAAAAGSTQRTVPLSSAATATGEITATLRMDYPILSQKLENGDLKVTLLQGQSEIAQGNLNQDGILKFSQGSATGTVTLRHEDDRVSYIDIAAKGLPAQDGQNEYRLRFSGNGFKTYTSDVLTLDTHSKSLIAGTGDATFTQGDLNADGKVDAADVEQVKEKLNTTDAACDLNGDGKVDISDLAAVTMAAGASGDAQIRNTSLIAAKVVDTNAVSDAIAQAGTVDVQSGEIASLFSDDGSTVTLAPKDGASKMELPIPLASDAQPDQSVEMEQVQIVSSTANPVEKGIIIVETADGEQLKQTFGDDVPDGVLAMQTRDDGRKVVTISLGKRVPVKKVTIEVEVKDNQPVVIEQIKFVQDIVPENPVAQDVQVKNVKAQPGAKEVSLTWDEFQNITGYKIYYGTSADKMTNTIETDRTQYTVTGLENLKTYYFAVAPVSRAGGQVWEGGKSDIVRATPQPNSVPDKPDGVTVTAGDGLLTVSWKPGKDTEYSKVQYRKKDSGAAFTVLEGKYQTAATIFGLENETEYEVQVYGVNNRGNGPVSLTAIGKPEVQDITAPDLPTANRLDASIITSADVPWGNTDYNASKGSLPGSVYDGNYRTSWIASAWYNSRAFTFHFDKAYEMDYLIYVPDLGKDVQNNSGNRFRDYFTRFNISLNGQKIDASKVSFEKAKDNEYFIVKFPKTQVTSLTVEGVQWDGAGNISLSEIAFYQYDGLADEISALFDNDSHTALKSGVQADTIAALRTRAQAQDAYYVDRAVMLDELDNAQQLLENRQDELTVRSGFTSRSASADAKYGQSASALQPLGLSALSNQSISVYVEGLGEGDSLSLVQWQQYSESSATRKNYALHNGRNRIYLEQIGNAGSGERGGSLYVEYQGSNAAQIKLQVRDTSQNHSVITEIPLLNLTPDQWYGKSESERKAVLRPYVEALKAYVPTLNLSGDSVKRTNTRNATEIATPSVLLSLPADQVLAGLGGAQADVDAMTNQLYKAISAWEELIFLANKTQGIIAADANINTYEYPMQTRQNIRFSRMFSGAFMFAAGTYVGIDYTETRGMVTGYPLAQTAYTRDSDDVNGLYGWGIAHEVGHNMDKIGYAEITNNIYSLVAQTAESTGALVGPSRLEGMYPSIFSKVARGEPGQAGDVFVQLGMYWQLHLAYDEDGDALHGSGPLDFYNKFFTQWKAGAHSDAPTKDARIARIAGDVTGKDLTEFFTRWGMELDEQTKQMLADNGTETRDIWYLNDQSRRLRLNGQQKVNGLSASVDAAVIAHPDSADESVRNTVRLTINVNDASMVQGYEILRNDDPIAFVISDGQNTQTYDDVVGAANNMAFSYKVRVIDKLGFEADVASAREVRISYDKVIDADTYDITRDEDGTVLITAKNDGILHTSGIKITGAHVPLSGSFTVRISQDQAADQTETVEQIPALELVPAQPIEPEQGEEEGMKPDGEADEDTFEQQPEIGVGEVPDQTPEDELPAEPGQTEDGQPDTEEQPSDTEDTTPPTTDEGTAEEQPPAQDESTTGTDADQVQDEQQTNASEEQELPVFGEVLTPERLARMQVVSVDNYTDTRTVQTDDWKIAKQSTFDKNESQEDDTFLTYFNKPDVSADDTRIWMYDAKQIAISGIPEEVELTDIALLSYPGDNISFDIDRFLTEAFGEMASIGVLESDYTYEVSGGQTETIPEGTVIIVGSYRGDPRYNSVRLVGKFQSMVPGSSEAPTTSEKTLPGQLLMLAEIPEDGEVSDISDGIFLYIPKDQEAFRKVNEDHSDKPTLKNEVLIELKAQMWRAEDTNGSNPRMTSDTTFISVPRYDSMPGLKLESDVRRAR